MSAVADDVVECDVVVVGGGMAGLVAAMRATELGLRVVVVEAGEAGEDGTAYENNTRISGGVLVVAFRPASTPAAALEPALKDVTFGTIDPALAALVAHRAGPALEWLRANGAELAPLEFHAGMRFSEVLAPTGLTTTNVDWVGKGPDVFLRRLVGRIEAAGGTVLRGCPAESLRDEGGAVVGAVAGGRTFSSRAVVLADGGFQADPDLVREHIAPAVERVVLRAAPTSHGWGLRQAAARGARLVNLDSFYGHLLSADALHDDRLWPYPVLDPVAEAGIVVDRNGRRYADERKGGVHLANHLARTDDPFGHVVCDDTVWQGVAAQSLHPPSVNPWLERSGGTVVRADTLADLETAIGVPAGSLGENDGRLQTAPFHAVPVVPGISFTMGGPLIDTSARVVDERGAPIPGLYAAGSCCGGFEGGEDVGYTGGLMRAVITAMAAVEHVAGHPADTTATSNLGARA